MRLERLSPPEGAKRAPRRVGRGIGSGRGKTSGRGHKGQRARSGGTKGPMFEGGQMPLVRRVPKRGFTNPFKVRFVPVNLRDLEIFEENAVVSPETLQVSGVIKRAHDRVKILGEGNITKPLTVRAHAFSRSAVAKIEQAGGKVEVI
ncbi:MAG: 50S ribosomal protein L15 [Firmicutes bacterium]|nr:50S ribosomal protein L15 [Bacillota bacterium]